MSESTIEKLQDLCAEHGCPPGINRFTWLNYMLNKVAKLEAERDAYKAQANLLEHKVITCGVAASHSDANLARTGAYGGKWDSAQAVQVRALRAERDALRKDAERYRWLRDEAWSCDKRGRLDVHVFQFGPGVLMSAVTELAEEALDSAIDAAIAAKEPNRE